MKKLTPLIVLGIFVIGMYFMLQGMNNAVAISQPDYKSDK